MVRVHRSRTSTAVAVSFAVLGLALGACGSDKKSTSTTGSTTAASAAVTTAASVTSAAGATTTAGSGAATTAGSSGATTTAAAAAAPTGDPVVIGVVTALTGQSASSYSPFTGDVAKAWESWVNAKMGGIGGRPAKLVVEDSAAQAAQAQSAVKKLVESDKAVAIIVNDTTSETAISDYTAQNNIPVIGGSTNAAPIWLGKPNYFMLGSTNPVSSAAGMIVAKASGATNFGAVYCAEVPACAQANDLYSALGAQIPGGGLTYGGGVPASASQPNYTAECLKVIGNKSDWIQLSVSISTGLKVYAECSKQGYTGQYGASNQTIAGAAVEKTAGIKFGGSITFFPWFAESPAAKKFRDVMAEYAKGADYASVSATTLWTTLELFRKTMKTAPASSADVMTAYQGITNEKLDGLLPQPISFAAGKPSPALNCFWGVHFEGGKWTTIKATGDLASLSTGNNGMTDDLASLCFTPKLS